MRSGVLKLYKALALITVAVCGAWAAAGLVFRFSVYGSMPVAPGDSYGEADVLEYFLCAKTLTDVFKFDHHEAADYSCL